MARAYYGATFAEFLRTKPESVLGTMAGRNQFALDESQRNAWMAQVEILKANLTHLPNGYLLLEYSIPRMGKRVDAVLLIRGVVIVLEFKVGESEYTASARDQALDYALDLKNFHEQSRDRAIAPIVVATKAEPAECDIRCYEDRVYAPVLANAVNLRDTVWRILEQVDGCDLDPVAWCDSAYRPTPTIIEAAQALYQGHSVADISRSDGGAINLSQTSDAITEIIESAKANQHRAIVFVTGVPGAGKTLAGLNVANKRLQESEDEHAVFLSGNGPLVSVLRAALARNEVQNAPPAPGTRGHAMMAAQARVGTFIQNIHHFRDEALESSKKPLERVAVFDEAQRAWTLDQTAGFMRRKKNVPDFAMSEPRFLISYIDRHRDWAVIVCLIGGGQEINTGEAGLLEWFSALRDFFPDWRVYFSPNLTDDEYTRGQDLKGFFIGRQPRLDKRLHLAVSLRSFRAENVSGLVKAVLDNDVKTARDFRDRTQQSYPIVITRDLSKARHWLRNKARGNERAGILASSGAIRLRPEGITVRAEAVDVVNWFLNDKEDIRSSCFLEEVATEFDVQGLELDWACVAWDADLRYVEGAWDHKAFRGTAWQNVNDETRRRYLKNAYRVLLTRARQGMVIFVPRGDATDKTRPPEFYDGTFEYLRSIGFPVL